jgi:hypothetical protein
MSNANNDSNLVRLKAVMALFRIRPIDLCKGRVGYSKGYVSGVLSGSLQPSPEFFLKLNAALLELITQSGGASSVFDVPPVKMDVLQPVVDTLLKSA